MRSAHRFSASVFVAGLFGFAVGYQPRDTAAETPIRLATAAEDVHLAFRRMDWPLAVQSAKLLMTEARPDDPYPAYYLAAAHARAGEKDAAVQALAMCVERGWFQAAAFERDPDLESVRSAPEFGDLVEKARRKSGARLERYKASADRPRLTKSYPQHYSATTPCPLILAFHGYGSSGLEIEKVWRKAADEVGAILIAPTSPHVVEIGQHGWGVVEESEAIARRLVEKMTESYAADPSKIILTGFSQGAMLAVNVGLRNPERFAGVIPICGTFDPATATIPLKNMSYSPRFAILNGADDAEVENNRTAARLLSRIGVPVRLRLYPGIGHAYPRDADAELRGAARFVLGLPDDSK